jgi:hypothetical protein
VTKVSAFAVVRKDGSIAFASFGGAAIHLRKPELKSALAWAWCKDDPSRYSRLGIELPKDYNAARKRGYKLVPVTIVIPAKKVKPEFPPGMFKHEGEPSQSGYV